MTWVTRATRAFFASLLLIAAGCSESAKSPTESELASELASHIKDALIVAGLSETEAEVITESARTRVLSAVSINSLAALDKEEVGVVLPLLVGGAVEALDDENAGQEDETERIATIRIIVGKAVALLEGRVAGLDDGQIAQLTGNVVGYAVRAIDEGGVDGAEATLAVSAVVETAVGGVDDAGFSEAQVILQAGWVVEGTIRSLKHAGAWELTDYKTLLAATVKAAVGAVDSASVSAESTEDFIREVTESATESLESAPFVSNDTATLARTVVEGAFSALPDTGIAEESYPTFMQGILIASVEGLWGEVGLGTDWILLGAQSAYEGAVGELDSTQWGFSATEISAHAAAFSGIALATLDEAGLTADDISGDIATITRWAVEAVRELDELSSGEIADLVILMISTMVDSLDECGVLEEDVATLEEEMASEASTALHDTLVEMGFTEEEATLAQEELDAVYE